MILFLNIYLYPISTFILVSKVVFVAAKSNKKIYSSKIFWHRSQKPVIKISEDIHPKKKSHWVIRCQELILYEMKYMKLNKCVRVLGMHVLCDTWEKATTLLCKK